MFKSIFITGLGGQGVVTFAKLLAASASEQNLKVSLFNSKGMAQRGGRVTSEIRISSDYDFMYGSRLSGGGADILIGMEIGEAVNSYPFLKKGGLVILLDHAFIPTTMILQKEEYPRIDQILKVFAKKTDLSFGVLQARSPHNIFLLGFLSSILEEMPEILPGFTREKLENTIRTNLKRNLEENLDTFQEGYVYGRQCART
jgi:indolepyruvate ferredoxin oxidoreductase beta subunit